MNMGIDGTGGHDMTFTSNDFGAGTDMNRHIRLNIAVTGFTNRSDVAIFNTDIGFDDPPMIKNQGVGDHAIHHLSPAFLPLAHAIANHFATTEFNFIAIGGEILFNFNP